MTSRPRELLPRVRAALAACCPLRSLAGWQAVPSCQPCGAWGGGAGRVSFRKVAAGEWWVFLAGPMAGLFYFFVERSLAWD
jgi:hypothetical protein